MVVLVTSYNPLLIIDSSGWNSKLQEEPLHYTGYKLARFPSSRFRTQIDKIQKCVL